MIKSLKLIVDDTPEGVLIGNVMVYGVTPGIQAMIRSGAEREWGPFQCVTAIPAKVLADLTRALARSSSTNIVAAIRPERDSGIKQAEANLVAKSVGFRKLSENGFDGQHDGRHNRVVLVFEPPDRLIEWIFTFAFEYGVTMLIADSSLKERLVDQLTVVLSETPSQKDRVESLFGMCNYALQSDYHGEAYLVRAKEHLKSELIIAIEEMARRHNLTIQRETASNLARYESTSHVCEP